MPMLSVNTIYVLKNLVKKFLRRQHEIVWNSLQYPSLCNMALFTKPITKSSKYCNNGESFLKKYICFWRIGGLTMKMVERQAGSMAGGVFTYNRCV